MMIDWLPHGWRWTTLGKVVEEKKERVGDRLDPVVLSSTKYFGLVPSDEYFVNRRIYSSDLSNYKVVYRGWFAYATNHLTEGSIGLQSEFDLGAVSPMYTVFAPGAEVDPDYLFRVVKSPRLIAEYIRRENATVDRRGSVRFDKFATISISLPPIHEQRLIAAILNTVDAAIQQTDALIAKLRQMKAGLLHDLLTRGLDENGELRDPVTHPEQFQESVLGVIPRAWEIEQAEAICDKIVVGIVIRPAQYYTPTGVPVLRSTNITEYGIDTGDLVFMSEESNQQLAKSMLQTDDVVTVRTGEPGTSCVIPPEFDGSNCIDVIISRPGPKVLSEFWATWINSPLGKDQVLRAQGGLAQQHFNVGEMKKLIAAIPSPEEQKRITTVLSSMRIRVQREEMYRGKLALLKRGLIDDLLTGQVRVNIVEEKA